MVLGLYLVWRALWSRYWSGSRWFSRNILKFHDLEGDMSAKRLRWLTKTEELRVRWAEYSAFAETEKVFVLIDHHHSCIVIPKRAFPPEELNSFCNWVPHKS